MSTKFYIMERRYKINKGSDDFKTIININDKYTRTALQTVEAKVKEGQSLGYYIYLGQMSISPRSYGYAKLNAVKRDGSIELERVNPTGWSEFGKKVDGSYTIGQIIAVVVAEEGKTIYPSTGHGIGRWEVEDEVAEWEADEERLKVRKFAMAKMKDEGFDARLKRALEPVQRTYQKSDAITKQYILAKIINYLNS